MTKVKSTMNVEKTNLIPVNRTYKSRLFAMIYENKKDLLELYNAVNKSNYQKPELLEINTLENAIYMSMQNDVSFIIDLRLSLYEHQSTYNPNLPLRFLLYVSDLYSAMTKDANLYGTKIIKIPPPKFIVFYNGIDEQPDWKLLKLSDAYSIADEHPSLELEAEMLNINVGHNQVLMNTCKSLRDYAEYTARVREYAESMELNEAVERAITECICEGILAEFLEKNRAEAKSVSIYEYDMEKHMRQEREDAKEDGFKDGMTRGLEAKLKSQIEKKLSKGKSVEEIADDLEEEVETIFELIKKMEKENR